MPDYLGCVRISRLGRRSEEARLFSSYGLIVSNTPGIDAHVRGLCWTGRTAVISNFTRMDRVAHHRPVEAWAGPDALIVFAMGRFVHRKGFDVLIRAVRRSRRRFSGSRGGGGGQALRNLAAEIGAQDRVRFLGWLEDARPHLARATSS